MNEILHNRDSLWGVQSSQAIKVASHTDSQARKFSMGRSPIAFVSRSTARDGRTHRLLSFAATVAAQEPSFYRGVLIEAKAIHQ